MYSIYVTRWARSSLIYVGKTEDLKKCWSWQLRRWRRERPELGVPHMEVLQSGLTEKQSRQAKIQWIEYLDSTNQGEGLKKTPLVGLGKARLTTGSLGPKITLKNPA